MPSPSSADAEPESRAAVGPIPEVARALSALRRFLASVGDERASAASVAKESVCELVRRRRAEGKPPEAVVVEVKALVHEAGDRSLPRTVVQDAVDDAVRWCIGEYYK